MGDLSADKNQITEEKNRQSIFDSSKFWGFGPRHKESLSEDLEKRPAMSKKEVLQEQLPEITKIEDSQEQIPENNRKPSTPNSVKLYDKISGNFIITRGFDGTNMSVYQTRRKHL